MDETFGIELASIDKIIRSEFIESLTSIVRHWYAETTSKPLLFEYHEQHYGVYHSLESNCEFLLVQQR